MLLLSAVCRFNSGLKLKFLNSTDVLRRQPGGGRYSKSTVQLLSMRTGSLAHCRTVTRTPRTQVQWPPGADLATDASHVPAWTPRNRPADLRGFGLGATGGYGPSWPSPVTVTSSWELERAQLQVEPTHAPESRWCSHWRAQRQSRCRAPVGRR